MKGWNFMIWGFVLKKKKYNKEQNSNDGPNVEYSIWNLHEFIL